MLGRHIPADAPVALGPGHSLVIRGYPYLLETIPWFTTHGVRFHDATGIFDDEPEIVYADNCCHYNQLGNEILAEFIAGRVLEEWPAP